VLWFAVLSFDWIPLRTLAPLVQGSRAFPSVAFVAGSREILFAIRPAGRESLNVIDYRAEFVQERRTITRPTLMVIRQWLGRI
jgi:hypothetical protein